MGKGTKCPNAVGLGEKCCVPASLRQDEGNEPPAPLRLPCPRGHGDRLSVLSVHVGSRRVVQSCPAPVVGLVHVGPRGHQGLDAVEVAVGSGIVQRGPGRQGARRDLLGPHTDPGGGLPRAAEARRRPGMVNGR